MAAAEAEGDLAEMRTYLERDSVKEVYREAHMRLMYRQVRGGAIVLAGLSGVPLNKLDRFFMGLGRDLAEELRQDREMIGEKLAAAKARYRFI